MCRCNNLYITLCMMYVYIHRRTRPPEGPDSAKHNLPATLNATRSISNLFLLN